jgi:superfamily II RNA helicase
LIKKKQENCFYLNGRITKIKRKNRKERRRRRKTGKKKERSKKKRKKKRKDLTNRSVAPVIMICFSAKGKQR